VQVYKFFITCPNFLRIKLENVVKFSKKNHKRHIVSAIFFFVFEKVFQKDNFKYYGL